MATQSNRPDPGSRLEAATCKLSPHERTLVGEVARWENKTVSQFLRDAALDRALRVVERERALSSILRQPRFPQVVG